MPDRYRIIVPTIVASQLEEIFDYIAQDSPQNAGAMIDRILHAIEGLGRFPHRQVLQK